MPRFLPEGSNLGKLLSLGPSEHLLSLSPQRHSQIACLGQEPPFSSLTLSSKFQSAPEQFPVSPRLCEVADIDLQPASWRWLE